MQDLTSNKYIIGGVILAVLLVAGYFLFSGGDSTPTPRGDSLTTSSGSPVATSQDNEVVDTSATVRRLNRLESIRIQTAFLEGPAFDSLLDFSISILPQDIGRNNPFTMPTYTQSGDVIVPNNPDAGLSTTLEQVFAEPNQPAPAQEAADTSSSTNPDAGQAQAQSPTTTAPINQAESEAQQ